MSGPNEPWWGKPLGIVGAMIGAALWIVAIAVAWHFIGKYW